MRFALERGYRYLHILQSDMQILWWDNEVMQYAEGIFEKYPHCVNIQLQAHSQDTVLSGDLEFDDDPRWFKLSGCNHSGSGSVILRRVGA
jgi:hypothetical protein